MHYFNQLHCHRGKQQSFCCLQLSLPGEKKRERDRDRERLRGVNPYVTLPELCDMFYHCDRQKQQGANPCEPLQTCLIKFYQPVSQMQRQAAFREVKVISEDHCFHIYSQTVRMLSAKNAFNWSFYLETNIICSKELKLCTQLFQSLGHLCPVLECVLNFRGLLLFKYTYCDWPTFNCRIHGVD